MNLPIGLQLYTVGDQLNRDLAGTLKAVAAAGYLHVELAAFDTPPVKAMKQALDDNGLQNPSGHYLLPDLISNLNAKIDIAKDLGQTYMVAAVPWIADPSRVPVNPQQDPVAFFLALVNNLTLDDWKWNAEQFNKIGEQIRKAGLQLGYHNHNFEWRTYNGVTAFDEFLRLTDPDLVKLELDCGWVTVAGHDPVTYLTQHAERCRLLHIKDFKPGFTPRTTLMDNEPGYPASTELGRGSIDYNRIFAAAREADIRFCFVEQEPPFTDMPALESIKVNYDYLRTVNL